MIDHTLAIPAEGTLFFYIKQVFWLYVWPVLVGFVAITAYQVMGKLNMMGTAKWPVTFTVASLASMLSLFGWMTMVRMPGTIPLYGIGVGLANVMMSRIYAVLAPRHPRLRIPTLKVVWQWDKQGIQELRKMFMARAAAQQS
jgi:hypothetical protein